MPSDLSPNVADLASSDDQEEEDDDIRYLS